MKSINAKINVKIKKICIENKILNKKIKYIIFKTLITKQIKICRKKSVIKIKLQQFDKIIKNLFINDLKKKIDNINIEFDFSFVNNLKNKFLNFDNIE